MAGKDREYVSESHAQYAAIRKTRFWAKVGAFVVGSFMVWTFYQVVKPVLYSAQDRQALELIKEYRERSQAIRDDKTRKEYLNMLKEEEDRIRKKYSTVWISLWGLSKHSGKTKAVLVLLMVFPFLVFLGIFAYLKRWLWPRWDEFFLSVPQRESPLVLPKKGLTLWGTSPFEKEVFSDPESFKKVFAYAEGLPEKEVSKEIQKILKDAKEFLNRFYSGLQTDKVLFYFQVILWHYCGSLYANLPTGLLSLYVKDYGLKKLLSLYARNHLPAFLDVTGKFLEEEYSVYVLCRLFYECDQAVGMRERLNKFSPLPFEIK